MARYTLLEKLGEGGMGAVYRAVQAGLEREVALKVLPPGASKDPEMLARFNREIRSISQLQHPNIVRVFDWGELDGQLFYTMEILRGRDLTRAGALPFLRAARLMEQAADALALLHEQDLYHRDIKPHNFVLEGDRLVLVDFGLATRKDATMLTEDGAVVGTARFLAPEALQGQPARASADVYALALTAHEVIAGEPGFQNASLPQLMVDIMRGERPTLAGVPAVPSWFLALQARALAIDPAARPSAAGYRDELRRHGLDSRPGVPLQQPAPAPAPAPRRPSGALRRRSATPAIALAAALALAFTFTVGLALRPHPPAPRQPVRGTVVVPPSTPPPPALAREPARRAAARSFLCWPTERSVFVDVDVVAPARVVVEVGPWTTRASRWRAVVDAPEGYAQAHVEGLPADTDLAVRVALAPGALLIADYRVRTLTARHARTVAEMQATARTRPLEAGMWAEIFHRTPDPRCVAPLVRMLSSARGVDIDGFSKVPFAARLLRSRELADALMKHYDQHPDLGTRAEILLAAVAARHPEASRLALAQLPQADRHALVEAGALAAARVRGLEPCRAVVRAMERLPATADLAPWLPAIDPACTREVVSGALAHGARTHPDHAAGAFAALGELGDDHAIAELATDIRRRLPRSDAAAATLAAIGTPAAARALASFSRDELPLASLLTAAARAGDEALIPHVLPARDSADPGLRREAVVALAGCGGRAAVPALRRALADADGEAAALAACALAHAGVREPGLVDEVLALARGPRDVGGLAAFAAARIGGAGVAREVGALLKERVKAGAPAITLAGLKLSVAEAGAGTGPDQLVLLVPASAAWVRTGVRLEAGDSVDVSAVGWFARAQAPDAPWRPEIATTVDEDLPAMAVTAVIGADRTRVDRKATRVLARRAGELVLTPWVAQPASAKLVARAGLAGYAVVHVAR